MSYERQPWQRRPGGYTLTEFWGYVNPMIPKNQNGVSKPADLDENRWRAMCKNLENKFNGVPGCEWITDEDTGELI